MIPVIGLVLLLALIVAAVVNTAAPVFAADTGLHSPSANSNVGWDNPQYAYSSGDWRARADNDGDIVQYYNFNLPVIPSGSTIDGIEVRVEGYETGGTTHREADVSLSWDGGVSYTTGSGTGIKRTDMPSPDAASEAVRTFGGASDTWGRTWALDDFINANFRVKLDTILASTGYYLYVDHVQVMVHYTLPGTTTTVATSGSPSIYGDSVTFTATVTRLGGTNTPSGIVDFQDSGVSMGTSMLSDIGGGAAQATFATSSLTVGSHSISAVYDGDSNFTGSTSPPVTQVVNQRNLTVTATGIDKVYDATTTATVNLTTDAIGGDDVTPSYTSATFANKNVGTSKTVSVSGISVSGADAGNYNLLNTTASTTANITQRNLTVTATGVNKVYDATATATVNLTTNALGGDTVTPS